MGSDDINLLKTKTSISPQFSFIEEKLRSASLIALVVLLVVGIAVSGSFVWVNSRYQKLEEERSDLLRQINADYTKEGLLVALKQRVGLVEKALTKIQSWDKLLVLIERVAPVSSISSLSVDGAGHVIVNLELSSLSDALSLVSNVILLTEQQALRRPNLTSLSLREDGTVDLGISFIPILSL